MGINEHFLKPNGNGNNQVKSVATGEHVNLPGHSLANMTMTILEQVKKTKSCIERKEKSTSLISLIHPTKA